MAVPQAAHHNLSPRATRRYVKHKFDSRPLIHERGSIREEINARNWTEFVKPPEQGCCQIVREFYANVAAHENYVVRVREKDVSFDSTSINRLYRILAIRCHDYVDMEGYLNLDDIILNLCDGRTRWKENAGGPTSFSSGALTREMRAWHYFVCARLLPSSNTSNVHVKRAGLLYDISTGLGIDVGEVIMNNILSWVQRETSDEILLVRQALSSSYVERLKEPPKYIEVAPPTPVQCQSASSNSDSNNHISLSLASIGGVPSAAAFNTDVEANEEVEDDIPRPFQE
ncbi:hypothetical protein BUALT_Bualt14G0025800 [Buddleja alternifolia]|uniref:Putative plant transposon protein domain-containing protein n=1 Tax=Buddleja alternifolia TaxID=168488 RepID=A0AAV6WPQ2_9LAMI|nr:hypothetical protein BUALT_Bualt14G0025800 [Buddleja alternifolia]